VRLLVTATQLYSILYTQSQQASLHLYKENTFVFVSL
jgi:hypothetical protein